MKEKFRRLGAFDWRLFAALCALGLIPAIYQTLRTFIISSSDQSAVFDVIGQMEWFDLINETLRAFLIIPLYSVLNKAFLTDRENFARHTFKTGLLSVAVYSLFSVGVLIYGTTLIKAMDVAETDIDVVSRYFRLETIAFMIQITTAFFNVVFVVIGKDVNVYIFLAVSVVLSLAADLLLVPSFGAYGIAASNIIVNSLLAIAGFVILFAQKHIKPCLPRKSDIKAIGQWAKIGFFSGTQQFVDNLFYAVMVCKMVNAVAEQGNYWLANNFIWGWLLIPVTALSEVIRRDCKNGYFGLNQFNYYFITAAAAAVWAMTIPLWTPFFRYAENIANAEAIFSITIKLAPFYVAYAVSAVIDNIFVGLGKTHYNMINSLTVNLIYYGAFYILYLTDTIAFTMNVIILMFGCGMVVHAVVSLAEEKLFLRRKEICKLKT